MGHVHGENVARLGGQVVAGADIDPTSRDEFANEFGVPTYESHPELLAEEDLDAVIITIPNRYHEAAAVDALEADCYVLVEKPLAHSLESAVRIVDAARTSAGYCMVGFHSRFSPAAKATRAYRDEGRFGVIDHVEATFVRRRGIPAPGSWFTSLELAGGGSLIDVGVHVIDLAMDVLEFPAVSEVSGTTRTSFGPREDYADPDGFGANWDDSEGEFDVDDSVSAFLRFETGQTISLEVAWATNRPPANELVVWGTDAGAKFELEGEVVTLYETGTLGVDHHVTSKLDARGGPDGHLEEMRHFIEAVEVGEEPTMNTLDQALEVQRIIDGIYRSGESEQAVEFE